MRNIWQPAWLTTRARATTIVLILMWILLLRVLLLLLILWHRVGKRGCGSRTRTAVRLGCSTAIDRRALRLVSVLVVLLGASLVVRGTGLGTTALLSVDIHLVLRGRSPVEQGTAL